MKTWGSVIWLIVMIFTGAITTPIGIVMGIMCVGAIIHDLSTSEKEEEQKASPVIDKGSTVKATPIVSIAGSLANKEPKTMQNQLKSETMSEESLKEKEKAAIMYTLMLMASANGSYDQTKLDFAASQATEMEFDLESPEMLKAMQGKKQYACPILARMSFDKKEAYSIQLGSSAFLTGKPTKNELTLLQVFLTEAGVDLSKFKDDMNKLGKIADIHSE